MDDDALHRRFGAEFFNACWDLIEHPARSADDDLRMLHLAHASLAHWLAAGGPRERSVGLWQIARVLCLLGREGEAADLARRAVEVADDHDLPPFWRASAREGLHRALRRSDPAAAAALRAEAEALLAQVADGGDREVVLKDLAS
jgi:hypothetical protein